MAHREGSRYHHMPENREMLDSSNEKEASCEFKIYKGIASFMLRPRGDHCSHHEIIGACGHALGQRVHGLAERCLLSSCDMAHKKTPLVVEIDASTHQLIHGAHNLDFSVLF